MDQDNERLLDPDSNPDLEWWSDTEQIGQATTSSSSDRATSPKEEKKASATYDAEPAKADSPSSDSPTTSGSSEGKADDASAPETGAASTAKEKKGESGDSEGDKKSAPSKAAQAATTAVIDRFEGNLAVLLVGEDEKVINVPRSALPKRVRAGHWLKIQQSADDPETLVSAEVDKSATQAARTRIADKLAKLRSGEYLK